MNTEMVLPTAMKEKRLPAAACVMANSPSIIGRRGEKDILTQKLRNQRPQKITRRRIFMVAGYTPCRKNVQAKNSDVKHVPHHTSKLIRKYRHQKSLI
jgi:hypothetical protein